MRTSTDLYRRHLQLSYLVTDVYLFEINFFLAVQ